MIIKGGFLTMGTKRVGLARIEALMENLKRDLAMGAATFSGINANIMSVESTPVSLTAADSGKTILLNNGTTATTINLPAGSTLSAGCYFQFVPLSDNTNGYIIKRGTDDELIKGRLIVVSTTADNTEQVSSFATNDTLTLDATNNAAKAGARGSVVHCYWDGSAWQVWGQLISLHASPASVDSFSNT